MSIKYGNAGLPEQQPSQGVVPLRALFVESGLWDEHGRAVRSQPPISGAGPATQEALLASLERGIETRKAGDRSLATGWELQHAGQELVRLIAERAADRPEPQTGGSPPEQ